MIKHFRQLLSIRTISGKFFILTLTLTGIPILAVCLLLYPIVMDILRTNAENQEQTSVTVGNDFLDKQINDLVDLSNVILGNEDIQSILTTGSFDDYAYLQNGRKISKLMTDIINSKSYIVSYFIYDAAGEPQMRMFNNGFPFSLGGTARAESYFHFTVSNGPMIWLEENPLEEKVSKSPSPYLYVLKLLRSTSGDDQNLGYVVLQIDKSQFFSGLKFLKPDFSSQYYILNSEGNILFSLPEQLASILPQPKHKQQVKYKGYSFISQDGPRNIVGWKLVHLIETPKLYKDAEYIRNLTLLLYVIMAITGWVLSYWLGNSIRRPLYKIQKHMKMSLYQQKSSATFDTRDEVEMIGEKFVRILYENKQLNNQVVDAEIKALQAQINPHFLYNTLESLNWLAISRKQFEISEVIGSLGKFFRITISKGKDTIPVSEEIEHINSYMRVQHFRYEDKFDYFVEIDSEIESFLVPKFLLQPLVENALYHGLKPRKGKGTIFVSGEVKDDTLIFRVTDDGVGMSPQCLKEIEQCVQSSIPSRVYGLKNVHDRVRLRFGEPFGIHITSVEGLYTTSEIILPVILSQKGGVTVS